MPFTSATKWSAVNFLDRGLMWWAHRSISWGRTSPPWKSVLPPYAAQGCRVLLLAQCDGAEIGRLHGVVIPLALLVLENPIRPNAPKVFDYFHTQGVDVKVISGDNPVTVSAVAAQAGIRNAEQWVDARELKTGSRHRRGRAGVHCVWPSGPQPEAEDRPGPPEPGPHGGHDRRRRE